MRFTNQEVSFEVPEGWEERSVVAFAAPLAPGRSTTANVVVTRDALRPGETLRSYADRQLVELGRQLHGFELVRTGGTSLGGAPAVDMLFTWQSDTGPLEQRVLTVGIGPKVMTLTATSPADQAEAAAPMFERIIQSMSFAAAASPSAPGPSSRAMPQYPSQPPAAAGPGATPSGMPPPPIPSVPPTPMPGSVMPIVSPASMPPPSLLAASGFGSIPPPSSVRASSMPGPMSSSRGAAMAPPAPGSVKCDRDLSARTAVAALFEKKPEELQADDLSHILTWATRHEVVSVSNGAGRVIVVATSHEKPIVFLDLDRIAELNHFFRAERIQLPSDLPYDVLAVAIRTLFRGAGGFVGTEAFLDRQRPYFPSSPEESVRLITSHCDGAKLEKLGADVWDLTFHVITAQGAIERWAVSGEKGRIRSVACVLVVPEGKLQLIPPKQSLSQSRPGFGPPPLAGRGGTGLIPVYPTGGRKS